MLNTSFSKMAAGHGLIQIWWEKLPTQEGDGDLSLTCRVFAFRPFGRVAKQPLSL